MNISFIEQYQILIPFLGLLLIIAFLLKASFGFKKYDYGILFIFIWGLLLNGALFLDFFKISRERSVIIFIVLVLGFLGYSFRNKAARARVKETFDIKVFLLLFLFWVGGLFIVNLPLIKQFPETTVITGTQISDDSVVHANLSRGFEFTDGSRYTFSSNSNTTSPRAFHSFVLYSNLHGKEVYSVLLPSIIFGFSLIIFAIYSIINRELKPSKFNYLLLLAPVTPFILVNTAYIMFLNQIVVIPLLIAAVYFITSLDIKKLNLWDVIIVLTLSISVFNTYSILPLSIVVLALVLKLTHYLFEEWKSKRTTSLFQSFKNIEAFTKANILKAFVFLVFLLIISIPGIIATKNLLTYESDSQSLTSSVGNLPSGFIDPFHITGMWTSETPYRGYLSGDLAIYGILLLTYFGFQIFIIMKSKISSNLLLANIVLFLPLIGTVLILKNQYINFKFITFFTAIFVPTFFISLFKVAEILNDRYGKLRLFKLLPMKLFAAGVVVILFAMAIWFPLKGYSKFIPVIHDFQFNEMLIVTRDYLPNSRTMILSGENWLQYYSSEQDDFIPMTLYYVKSYDGSNLDKVIIDEAYRIQSIEYMQTYHPKVYNAVEGLKSECIVKVLPRYTLYDLKCGQVSLN
jgi:hypothetical protein